MNLGGIQLDISALNWPKISTVCFISFVLLSLHGINLTLHTRLRINSYPVESLPHLTKPDDVLRNGYLTNNFHALPSGTQLPSHETCAASQTREWTCPSGRNLNCPIQSNYYRKRKKMSMQKKVNLK